jgi:YVTN family beta-propeller protein
MKNKFHFYFLSFLATSLLITSCKKDNNNVPETPDNAVKGVYILNEGLGTDGSELSYFDLQTSEMHNDFFVSANQNAKLGSLANDIGIYGNKMYITVNGSDKVEVTDATTGEIIKTIDLATPRYVTFYGRHAFVSSYTDKVFAIDTATFAIQEIEVGRTPEQLVASGDKIFVANSGWGDYLFNGGEHDNTVSVIDGNTLKVIKTIEVAPNVDRIFADNNGHVYVNAETIYDITTYAVLHPSRLYAINVSSLSVVKEFEFGAELMDFYKDKAYLFTKDERNGDTRFLEMNTKDFSMQNKTRFENSKTLYGLGVDPITGDIWIADGMGYVENGYVYRFNAQTNATETYEVGGLPSKFIFKY